MLDVQSTQLVLNCCLFIMLSIVRTFVFLNCKKEKKKIGSEGKIGNDAHLVQTAGAKESTLDLLNIQTNNLTCHYEK